MAAAPEHSTQAPPVNYAADFARDGYVIARGLFDRKTMVQWKQTTQVELTADAEAKDGDPFAGIVGGVRVWMWDHIHADLLAGMGDAHLTPILKQLIGPNVAFLSAKAVFKNNATQFASPWHQDWFYWGGATKTSVWIALDDATIANGCLKVVPGSHTKVFDKQVVNDNTFTNRIADADIEGLEVRSLEAKAGDAIFFHDLLVHSSHPNTAGADRWSLIATYRDAALPDEANVWPSQHVIAGAASST